MSHHKTRMAPVAQCDRGHGARFRAVIRAPGGARSSGLPGQVAADVPALPDLGAAAAVVELRGVDDTDALEVERHLLDDLILTVASRRLEARDEHVLHLHDEVLQTTGSDGQD